jgi:selenocysteine lyase/cysteine desulfurase
LNEFRIPEQYQDSTLRISFNIGNTKEDIDELFAALVSAQNELVHTK